MSAATRLPKSWVPSRWRRGCSSVLFIACCVASGICDELITRSEALHRKYLTRHTRRKGKPLSGWGQHEWIVLLK